MSSTSIFMIGLSQVFLLAGGLYLTVHEFRRVNKPAGKKVLLVSVVK